MINGELTAWGLSRTLTSWWQDKRVRTLIQVLCLIGVGAVASCAKSLSPSPGIPGSSSILWLSPLIAGRALIRRDGAGLLMGTTMALWGIPMGLHNSLMHNLGLYGFTGLALDIAARLPHVNIRNPFGAILCGALAHMVKFGYIVSAALISSSTKHFLIVGLVKAAFLHLAFGAAAGLIGWLAYKACKTIQSKRTTRSPLDSQEVQQ